MTTTTIAPPTRDELVITALERLYWLEKALDRPQTEAQRHVVRGHAAAIRAALLTPPLRPDGIGGIDGPEVEP